MTSTALATVIIVNYNGAHLLPACLDALAEQADDVTTFDTVVVDNASADKSRELLARDYPWARVIASPTNLGFAGGNNLALRQVSTPYAVLLNNDAVPEPGWLRNLLDPFRQPGSHNVGIATGASNLVVIDIDNPRARSPDTPGSRRRRGCGWQDALGHCGLRA